MVFKLIYYLHIFNFKFSTFPQGLEKQGLWKCGKLSSKELFPQNEKDFHSVFHKGCGKQFFCSQQ